MRSDQDAARGSGGEPARSVASVEIASGSEIGRVIARLRRARGLTQADAGREVSLGGAYVSKIESGRTVSLLEHQLRLLRSLGARVIIEYDDDRSNGGRRRSH